MLLVIGGLCALAGTVDLVALNVVLPQWLTPAPAPSAPAPAPTPPAPALAESVAVMPPPEPPLAVAVAAPAPEPEPVPSVVVVRFDSEGTELDAAGLEALRTLARDYRPGTHLRVEGHADPSGREEGNLYFSRVRARTVVHALTELGVPTEALHAEAFGSSRPLDPTPSAAARALNRRVEIHPEGAP
jgi:OOP family OmpA-OmpF porin